MYYDCSPPISTQPASGYPELPSGPDAIPTTSELVILGGQSTSVSPGRLEAQLDALIGPVRVVEADPNCEFSFETFLRTEGESLPPRLLFKLRNCRKAGNLPVHTTGFMRELIKGGFQLIGSDLPKNEWPSAAALAPQFAEQGIFFVEGLDLDSVPEGDYVLIALPVPVQGVDRCLVRVVLKSVF